MISRIKNNFTELMENLVNKKDEILKENKIINLDNLLSFYEENKKIFLEKKEVLLNAINEYISNVDLKINLDLSFIEKLDITCAPGVSAPQTFGIWPNQAIGLLNTIAKTKKNLTLEVAEISPRYDYDDRTSRLIANLIYQVILKHFDCEIN